MAEIKITRQEIISLCRLCLGKDLVSIDIFEAGSELRHLYTKIVACLPVQVFATDTLPHKICEVCNAKVDDFYQFWTCTAKNQKQLNDWLQIATDQITDAPTIKVEAEDTSKNDEFDDYDDGARGDDSEDEDEEASVPKRIKTQHSDDEDTKPTELISSMVDESSEISDQKEGNRKRSKEIQSGSSKLEVITAQDGWTSLVKNKSKTCPICKKSYQTARNMRKHLKRIHFKSSSTKDIQREINIHFQAENSKVMNKSTGNFECNHCNEKFLQKSKLVDHISTHTGIEKYKYKCHICDKEYTRKEYFDAHLQIHEKTSINKNIDFPVDTGDFTMDEWNDFIKRRVTECPVCLKDYRTPRNMRKHLRRVHTSVKKYGCKECGKMLKSRDSLNMHRKYQHLGKKLKRSYNYECHYCGAKYVNKYTLSDHITSHTGIPNHVCKICNKGYACAASLRLHNIKLHLQFTGVPIPKFKCDICEKEFFEKKKLNKHKNWAHGDKFHLCKICGAKIKGSLKQHMVTHTGERKYCCHICGKKLRGKLKEHMLTHSGDRPYACEVCGGTFRNKWYLTVHMRTHNGIRPYTCEYCAQKFAARSCYTAHLKKHLDTKKKKSDSEHHHQCQLCRSSFPNEESLNEHIRKHFGV